MTKGSSKIDLFYALLKKEMEAVEEEMNQGKKPSPPEAKPQKPDMGEILMSFENMLDRALIEEKAPKK